MKNTKPKANMQTENATKTKRKNATVDQPKVKAKDQKRSPIAKTTKPAIAKQNNKKNKKRVRGTSETDNPKFASKDFMLDLIERAAEKEVAVEKIIEAQEEKRQKKASAKQEKLEQTKQALLEAQKKRKAGSKKNVKATQQEKKAKTVANDKSPKKKVRFA
ncbi:hypothetical protein DFQ28_002497 [Apophysomyces sp. BC1034]|nr:hypothetical protein DFQ30_001240 [Apophysomyces sp. BC1015]KAG0190085.1 hypothetical protein DFQ28_002497 [Apophysomyces sp. BC1034]